MQNFTFHNPTKVIFGKDTVPQIGPEARPYGKKCLFVYGVESIKKSGLYDRVKDILKKEKIAVVEHGGVKSNPLLSHAKKGIRTARLEKVKFILAVGGGSVIDESKAIAAGVKAKTDVWKFFTGEATIQDALPVLTVLTIPATGSEMNGGMVITKDETLQKYGFIDPHVSPKVSVLDPTVTMTISPSYTAYSASDAISHLVEGYFTCDDPWVPIQDRFVEGLVKTIMECTERILKVPDDYQARATFMWAATLAWNGVCSAGLGAFKVPSHMLEHPLSALYDIAHGAGLSITQPAWMRYALGKGNCKVPQFAERVFGVRAGSDRKKGERGIEAFKRWFDRIGTPTTFDAAGIPESDIGKITQNALDLARTWKLDEYTEEVIGGIYRLCI